MVAGRLNRRKNLSQEASQEPPSPPPLCKELQGKRRRECSDEEWGPWQARQPPREWHRAAPQLQCQEAPSPFDQTDRYFQQRMIQDKKGAEFAQMDSERRHVAKQSSLECEQPPPKKAKKKAKKHKKD